MEIIYCKCYQEKWNGICLLFGKKFFEAVFDLNKSAIDSFEKICCDYFVDTKPTCVYDAKQIYTICSKCLNEKLIVKNINTQDNFCLREYYMRNLHLSDISRNCTNKAFIETYSDFDKILL